MLNICTESDVRVSVGYCDFDDGHCGLSEDRNSELPWKIGWGSSPSLNTGPSYDHSTLSIKGESFVVFAIRVLLLLPLPLP